MKSKISFLHACRRIYTLDVKINGSLKVKRHTLLFTIYGTNSSLKERDKEEEQVSFNHVTVHEVDDLEADIDLTKALKTFEDGG